ncbi:MAG: TetR/AcrR family transcriptional regulator [Anaerolineae bacterium]|nr:TetR/AcrR family transcriptional regulator [Anaerolineae bacterium]
MTNRELQARERRQQILAAAKQLFSENGYHATSMRAINRKVGMSEALTYHYFPGGKLEIFQTIVREGKERKVQEIYDFVKTFRDDMPLREALLLFGRKIPELFVDEEYTQIVIRERCLLSERADVLAQLAQPPLEFMNNFLARRAAQGEIREMDFGMAINQLMLSLVAKYMFGVDEATYLRFMEQTVDFVMDLWSK